MAHPSWRSARTVGVQTPARNGRAGALGEHKSVVAFRTLMQARNADEGCRRIPRKRTADAEGTWRQAKGLGGTNRAWANGISDAAECKASTPPRSRGRRESWALARQPPSLTAGCHSAVPGELFRMSKMNRVKCSPGSANVKS